MMSLFVVVHNDADADALYDVFEKVAIVLLTRTLDYNVDGGKGRQLPHVIVDSAADCLAVNTSLDLNPMATVGLVGEERYPSDFPRMQHLETLDDHFLLRSLPLAASEVVELMVVVEAGVA